jgi:hypothetical protein
LNRDVTEQPATAEEPWAKIIRIAHRGVSSKKKYLQPGNFTYLSNLCCISTSLLHQRK